MLHIITPCLKCSNFQNQFGALLQKTMEAVHGSNDIITQLQMEGGNALIAWHAAAVSSLATSLLSLPYAPAALCCVAMKSTALFVLPVDFFS